MYSPGRIFYIACQKRLFDKLVDGGVNYPQFAMVTLLRLAACSVPLLIGLTSRCFAHSARASCAPRHCHPLNQFPLKSYGFPGAETVRKRFLLWKMGFSDAKIAPPPPYTPPGTIEARKGFGPLALSSGFLESPWGCLAKRQPPESLGKISRARRKRPDRSAPLLPDPWN